MNAEQGGHMHKSCASSSQIKSQRGGLRRHKTHPPAEALLTFESCWGRKKQIFGFAFNGVTLVNQLCSGAAPTPKHIWAAQILFSCFSF